MGHENLSDPAHWDDPPEQINEDVKDALFENLRLAHRLAVDKMPTDNLRAEMIMLIEGAMSYKSMVNVDAFSVCSRSEEYDNIFLSEEALQRVLRGER